STCDRTLSYLGDRPAPDSCALTLEKRAWQRFPGTPQERSTVNQALGTAASLLTLAMASSSARDSCASLPWRRNDTVRFSASRLPTANSSGTLAKVCSRTL